MLWTNLIAIATEDKALEVENTATWIYRVEQEESSGALLNKLRIENSGQRGGGQERRGFVTPALPSSFFMAND